MRGSGYAIGEILIFLAIAGIIGFLAGWVVFYRRPGKEGSNLSAANPNHVRQLENRARAMEAKMDRLEKRATALLATLDKRSPAKAAEPAPEQAKPEEIEEPDEADKAQIAPAAAAPAGAGKERSPAEVSSAMEGETTGAKQPEPSLQAEQQQREPADAAPAGDKAARKAGGDAGLAEADDRLARLEETLDKLSEKLAELDED